jgi:4-hydroxyphenylpyruvate dioxygenase
MAARAVGVLVGDAAQAYEVSVANGAQGVRPPTKLEDGSGGCAVVSEVLLYGDVVLRYISGKWEGPYLPGYTATPDEPKICYGLHRLDHAVGNVPKLIEHLEHVMGFTGFHEFAEFVAEDVGTVDSGLNSMVLANNNEMVLLPINEPTFGTKRKSQIQTYLEQNEGPGLQHLALKTHNIIATMREMQARSRAGGFEFQAAPGPDYYKKVAQKVGDILSAEEWAAVEEMGILVDQDDQGVLLQIFTKPLGDRPTIFIEIIERRGCLKESAAQAGSAAAEATAAGGDDAGAAAEAVAEKFKDVVQVREDGVVVEQAAGCGGFGKGNFSELFKSIEEYEKTLQV